MDTKLKDLPQDRASLEAIVRSLLLEGEQPKQRAEQESKRAEQEGKRANDLQAESLRQGNAPTNSTWKICGCNYNSNAIKNGITGRALIGWLRAEM